MKKISAVVCELNPFHDGHRYVFSKALENAELLIAVMSGNFVQRGECAVYNKYIRAKSAISAGADIVVELPFPFSSSSAEFFAAAGVFIAEGVGATDLYFGSECADPVSLKAAADILNSGCEFKAGRAAEQRAERLSKEGDGLPEAILSSPNDILAVEYCRRASIGLHPVKRIDTSGATALRQGIYEKRTDKDAVYPEKLRSVEFDYFRCGCAHKVFAEGGGGVANRLRRAAFETNDSEKWLEIASTKQYTNARLRRAALFSYCGVSDTAMRATPKFAALLAANDRGRKYLREFADSFGLTLITNPSDRRKLTDEGAEQYALRELSDKLFGLCAGISDPSFFAKHSPLML